MDNVIQLPDEIIGQAKNKKSEYLKELKRQGISPNIMMIKSLAYDSGIDAGAQIAHEYHQKKSEPDIELIISNIRDDIEKAIMQNNNPTATDIISSLIRENFKPLTNKEI